MRLRGDASVWTVIAVAGITVGTLLRVWVLTSPVATLEADEAVVGLMALRALDGDLSVFYWGALYGGSQEALLTAAAFAVTGASVLVLKLVALAVYAAAAVLVWRVGIRTVGDAAAQVGAALFWAWPPFFVWWSTKARAYFASGLLLGLAALLLVLRLRERDSRRDAALLGLVLGIGVWATLQSMLLALPALAWLAWRRPAAYRLAPLALPGFFVGISPWLAWNVRHDWNAVLPRSVAGSETSYAERFADLFTTVLPTWLGLRAPYSHDWLLGPLAGWTLLALALACFVYAAVRVRGRLEPLVLVAATFPFLYAATTFTFFTEEPRYLVFLAPIPALLLARGLVTGGPIVAALGLVVALAVSVAGLRTLERQGLYRPLAPDVRVPRGVEPAIHVLERNDVRRVAANYWLAYPITFESGERIIASPAGFWRYQPYHDVVRASARPGRVFVDGSAAERRARATLLAAGYRRVAADGFIVYLPR